MKPKPIKKYCKDCIFSVPDTNTLSKGKTPFVGTCPHVGFKILLRYDYCDKLKEKE
jgi:hypothetical protein